MRSQLPIDGIVITFDTTTNVTINEVMALRETEQIARPHRGTRSGERHRSGVTFDVLG